MRRVGNEKLDNRILLIPAAKGHEFSEGTMAAINGEGYAIPAVKQPDLLVAGCIQRYLDTRLDDTNGQQKVTASRGTYVWNNDGSIQETHLLKPCYIVDERTVGLTGDTSSQAGIILAVDLDGVTVDMR